MMFSKIKIFFEGEHKKIEYCKGELSSSPGFVLISSKNGSKLLSKIKSYPKISKQFFLPKTLILDFDAFAEIVIII